MLKRVATARISDSESDCDEVCCHSSSSEQCMSELDDATEDDAEGSIHSSSSEDSSVLYRLADGITASNVPDVWSEPHARNNCCVKPFIGNNEVHIDTSGYTAADYARLFITDDLVDHIVAQTNIFAQQKLAAEPVLEGSRKRNWTPTDRTEVFKLFGLVLLMGINKKPSIRHYWSTDPLYAMPIFGSTMSRNRFQLLLTMLHYNNNEQAPAPTDPDRDRLYKLRPIIDHLADRFQALYTPGRDVVVDESLLLWKGRLYFKQYMPMKRSRFGMKLYKLCESTSGYTYRFIIYVGKGTVTLHPNVLQPTAKLSTTDNIVWSLMQPLLNLGYHLYVDNYYTSLPLFQSLLDVDTYACGTVRCNRRGLPKQLLEKKQQIGETLFLRNGSLLVLKFTDKNDVYMLTSIHDHTVQAVTVRRRRSTTTLCKPTCVLDYNKLMGAVDLSDQLIQPYDASRKSMVWYKKLVVHLFQLALLNAHILYQKSSPLNSKSFLDFTHDVIFNFILHDRSNRLPSAFEVRLTGRHFIQILPHCDKKRRQKRCRVCHK